MRAHKRMYPFNIFQSAKAFKPETKILFIILCILLCLYAFSFFPRSSQPDVFSSCLVLEQDIREVAEISFSIPNKAEPTEMGKMKLSKSGDRFYFQTANGRYPVRAEIINRFFSALSANRSFLTVSAHPHHYSDYAINDEQATRITFIRNDKTVLANLFFGMTDTIGVSRYVRTGRSIKVFLIDDVFEPFLTVAAPFWLDMQVYAALFRGSSIQGLEYGKNTAIRGETNESDFRALELFLEKLSCIDVYNAPALQTPQTIRVRLNLGDGYSLHLSFSPLQSGDYVFFDSRSPNVYLMSGYTCAQLIRRIEAVTAER